VESQEILLAGLTLVPAHQHVPVQSNRSSEITLAQTAEMLLLKLASFLKTTGAPGENGPPVHQLAQAQEAEIDLIFVITQETLQLKFAPSQVIGDYGLLGPHALKLALEVVSQDQDSISAPTKFKLRNENVAVQAHGVVGTTGLLALCHAVVEPKHAPEFTPALLLIRL